MSVRHVVHLDLVEHHTDPNTATTLIIVNEDKLAALAVRNIAE
jgi:hypothetical protein